jgi:myo-inositol 2-dehydrogenase/D-chiro-inositol 1-dehydrogenase
LRLQKGDVLSDVAIPHLAGEVYELEGQFARFVDAIQIGIAPAATAEDGRWSVAMCLNAQESVKLGKPVMF